MSREGPGPKPNSIQCRYTLRTRQCLPPQRALQNHREQGPRGVQHPTLKVERDEDTYHGVFTGQRGEVLIKEIQVEGNAFSFPLKVPTPMGKIKLHYSGQIDAGLIQGKIKTPRGAMPFTGKRME